MNPVSHPPGYPGDRTFKKHMEQGLHGGATRHMGAMSTSDPDTIMPFDFVSLIAGCTASFNAGERAKVFKFYTHPCWADWVDLHLDSSSCVYRV